MRPTRDYNSYIEWFKRTQLVKDPGRPSLCCKWVGSAEKIKKKKDPSHLHQSSSSIHKTRGFRHEVMSLVGQVHLHPFSGQVGSDVTGKVRLLHLSTPPLGARDPAA